MVKMTATTSGGRTMVFIGLSHANLDRLRADGLNGFIKVGDLGGVPVDILITAGETELEIGAALKEFIGPDTKVHIDPRLRS